MKKYAAKDLKAFDMCCLIKQDRALISALFVVLLFVRQTLLASVCTPKGTLVIASTSAANELSSPGYPNPYPAALSCQWNITAPAGHFVKLNFSDFILQHNYQSACSNGDYLELHDGASSSDDIIKSFCPSSTIGDGSPLGTIYSTGRHMYVEFRSYMQTSNTKGFRVVYTAVKHATSCSILNSDDQNSNIVLTRASGTISSPEFPQGYPPNTECTWNIKLPNHNSIVNLTFTSFNIKDGVNPYCPVYHDRVEVFDGFASGGDPLGRFCAKSPPRGTMFSTGRHLAIVLSSKFEKGFSASYSSISQTGTSGTCEKVNVSNHIQVSYSGGVVVSPNYPRGYPNNMDCTWTVTVPPGNRIKLRFMGVFGLEDGSGINCKDYLEIRDGSIPDSASLGKFCGNTKPAEPVYTSGRHGVLHFKTDSAVSNKGFYLMYEAVKEVCSQHLTSLTASPWVQNKFSSPEYPHPYPEGFTCQWNITAPPGYFVKVYFEMFKLQYNNRNLYCTNGDYVELRDGSSSQDDLIKRFCYSGETSTLPPIVTGVYSTGRHMYMKFRSDPRGPNRQGFSVTYTAVKQVTSHECTSTNQSPDQNRNIVLTGAAVNIYSPNFPRNYPSNLECTWTVKLPNPNSIVNLTFRSFDLDFAHKSCLSLEDYIEIFDGFAVQGVSLGRFCSNSPPPTIYSTGRRLTIFFHSDHSGGEKGFKAFYSSSSRTGISGECAKQYVRNEIQVTNSGGALVSPNFPHNYPSNMRCTWTITVPVNKRVKLQFMGSFGLVEFGCLWATNNDYVEIRDGSSKTSKSLGKFCKGKPDEPVITSGRHALIRLNTDSFSSYKGFYLVYEATNEEPKNEGYCSPYKTKPQSFNLRKSSGSISSPNYPGSYPPNMDCVWKITVSEGKRVKLTVQTLDIYYYYTSCNSGHLEVKDGQYYTSPVLGQYCGTDAPGDIYSTDRYMWVGFISLSKRTQKKGFYATFTEVDKESSQTSDSGADSTVGIVIGSLLLFGFIVFLVYCCRKCEARTDYRSVPPAATLPMEPLPQGTQQHPPAPHPSDDVSRNPIYPTPSAPQLTGSQQLGSQDNCPQDNYPSLPRSYTAVPPSPQESDPPPQFDDLPPPPPYPGLPAASAVPQYPPPGQQYPWQPEGESKPSAPC